MKKNLNKLIAIGIAMGLVSTGIFPAYGKEDAKKLEASTAVILDKSKLDAKPILTVDMAIEKAIENSDKLSLKSKEIKMYKEKIDAQESLNDEISAISTKSDYSKYFLETTGDYYLDQYDINISAAKQEREFLKDKISRDIQTKYNDLVLREIEIAKLKKEIEIKNNQVEFAKVNMQSGYGTETQKMTIEIALQKLKNDLSSKENLLKNKKDYFAVLTDLDLNKYNLDYTLSYKKINVEGNTDLYIEDKIDEYLKYKDSMLDLSEDYTEDLEDELDDSPKRPTEPSKSSFVNGVDEDGNVIFDTSGYTSAMTKYASDLTEYVQEINSYLKYLEIDYEVASSKVKLDDTKKLLKNKLDEAYSSLKDVENQISLMNDQFALVNKNLQFAKVQYDTGMMTLTDYNDKVVQSEELEIGLRKLVNGYNTLKDTIEKPWCAIE